jgi:hypothetical protein
LTPLPETAFSHDLSRSRAACCALVTEVARVDRALDEDDEPVLADAPVDGAFSPGARAR